MAVAAVVVTLMACTPEEPPPGPPSSPTVTSSGDPSPSPSPSPSPTMPTEADKQAAINAYIEANKIVDDVGIKGGAEELPASLEQFADPSGSWYEAQLAGAFEAKAQGYRFSARTKVIASRATVLDANTQRVYVCVDGRHMQVIYKEIGPKPGALIAGNLIVKRQQGEWRITDFVDGKKFVKVDECEG
ncbi:hypothetical protein [Microlunatus sp. Y2014]|uniref:hypothetical protein n=1 Tax=Microlunatus sp. Y2014 TaxID=3418488 RepID=UPI003DA71420